MSELKTFTDAVVACLSYGDSGKLIANQEALAKQVRRVLDELPEPDPGSSKQHPDRLEQQPTREQLGQYLADIRAALPAAADRIALIAGGATKIKGYVFEAPKLPEIRGASALLDWVNDVGLRDLWRGKVGEALGDKNLAEECIIYASGGGFLAFAPAELGEEMAAAVERCYTEHTLTANSVAVSKTFSLLELRYGRLTITEDQIGYWFDDFEEHWKQTQLHAQLARYYYGSDTDTPAERFYRRKTFGELVTLLATMTSRRREERASHGDTRSMPFYQMLPWAEQCDSSGMRPAVWSGTVVDEERHLSEASARKRYIGQILKKDDPKLIKWYERTFSHWKVPETLRDRSWEHQWDTYIGADAQGDTTYATFIKDPENTSTFTNIEPPKDVGQISQAAKPRRYIGVIYADGNNVGRLVATLKTPRQYAAVSKILSDVAQEAVFQALARYLEPVEIALTAKEQRAREIDNRTIWVHPFEILTIGGDDLFILVPGHTALDVAASISVYFEAKITEKLQELERLVELDPPKNALSIASHRQRLAVETMFSARNYAPLLGLSAGVIVAQENAPIFFLRDLVEELLKSAKAKARDNAKHGFYGGAVDFMVMKSITMVTDKIKSFRKQALGDEDQCSARRLTARPYTWHEFAGLLDTVRALKKARVPRSQLYRLRGVLDAEPGSAITPSVMEYLYTRVRLQSHYSDALQKHIDQPWCWSTPVPQRIGGLPPWMPLGKQGWETIWPDMLEAYEMVPESVEEQP